jgi:hypothetical protein
MAIKKKTAKEDKTVSHTINIPVQENVNHALYLREEIGRGNVSDGRELEVSQSGGNIIVMVGEWGKEGRQFVLNITDMVKALVNQTLGETGASE